MNKKVSFFSRSHLFVWLVLIIFLGFEETEFPTTDLVIKGDLLKEVGKEKFANFDLDSDSKNMKDDFESEFSSTRLKVRDPESIPWASAFKPIYSNINIKNSNIMKPIPIKSSIPSYYPSSIF